jgi:hypothetical protein
VTAVKPTSHLAAVASLLAFGLLRLRSRACSDLSKSTGEVRLDFSPTESVHGSENREGGK